MLSIGHDGFLMSEEFMVELDFLLTAKWHFYSLSHTVLHPY